MKYIWATELGSPEEAEVQPDLVVVPALAGEGSAVAEVEIAHAVQAEADPDAGVDDRVPRSVADHHDAGRREPTDLPPQGRPADQLRHRDDVQPFALVDRL